MKPLWHLEQLQLSQGRAYVNGWCFIPNHPIEALYLELRNADGIVAGQFSLSAAHPRSDVQAAHPQHDTSLYSGFFGVGAWPRQPQAGDQVVFNASVRGGERVEFAIPSERLQTLLTPIPSSRQRRQASRAQLLSYAKRALWMLTQGQFRSLYTKVQRQLSGSPQKPLGPVLSKEILAELGASPGADIHLVVDHRLGGGANQYRQRMIQPWLEAGSAVLTLTYHLPSLQSMLVVETSHRQQRFSLGHENDLIQALSEIRVSTITYNTAVSFVEAELIPALLLKLRKLHKARLRFLLHDFFSVCPSHFLINAEGHFCNIPDLGSCQRCLHRNPNGFTSLFSGDVLQWREAWGPLLRQADELIAFSHSTEQLVRKAFEFWPDGSNWLEGRSIDVRPHRVDYMKGQSVQIEQTERLVIGVVGQIGFHKGAELVRLLADEIQRQGTGERIAVIGSLEVSANASVVHQSGPYDHRELAAMIQKSGANVMLFPSIWPETFSYVTQEILELDLPLACLDLGAQAERVRTYSKGRILSATDPGKILEELRLLLKMAYQPQQSPQP